jgi:hypothetical protein
MHKLFSKNFISLWKLGCYKPTPLKMNLAPEIRTDRIFFWNSAFNSSSLSQVASSSVWWLHCTLHILIFLFWVTLSDVSKILTRGVETELQKLRQKECDVTEKIYARESTNGGRSRRLDDGERGGGLHRDGEKRGEGGGERSVHSGPTHQRWHADGKPVQQGCGAGKQSPISIGSTCYAVSLNRLGQLFNWVGPNPLLKSFSIYPN